MSLLPAIVTKNEEAVKKYLSRSPEDAKKILAYLKESGKITDTPFVINLIATARENAVYKKDSNVARHIASIEAEFVSTTWMMTPWYSAQYNSNVVLNIYRDRPKLTDGIYRCARCGQTRTRQRTTRASGDESIPVKIFCVGCGHTWSE